ncbi:hypothetical protein JB92DRAFT_2828202 [Gautieria morchelliformis]|nr:hypothetical protein JB92DRAFT_2828202 [Gautieria morchelliformis]
MGMAQLGPKAQAWAQLARARACQILSQALNSRPGSARAVTATSPTPADPPHAPAAPIHTYAAACAHPCPPMPTPTHTRTCTRRSKAPTAALALLACYKPCAVFNPALQGQGWAARPRRGAGGWGEGLGGSRGAGGRKDKVKSQAAAAEKEILYVRPP